MDKSPFTHILVLKIMVFITLSFHPIAPKFTPHNSLPTPLTQNHRPPPKKIHPIKANQKILHYHTPPPTDTIYYKRKNKIRLRL